MEIEHISARPVSLYKFKIPEILDFLDIVLYIDGDILFEKDIYELFSTDLGEYYAAVTPENIIGTEPPPNCQRIESSHLVYFNSGLMLLNLEKMRRDNIPEKLIHYRIYGKNFLMDQDAFNAVIGDNVLCLSPLYFTAYYEINDPKNFIKYGCKSKKEIIKKSYILHLATKNKPWVKKQPWITKEYIKYHRMSPFKKIAIVPSTYLNQYYNQLYDKLEGKVVFNIARRIVRLFRRKPRLYDK